MPTLEQKTPLPLDTSLFTGTPLRTMTIKENKVVVPTEKQWVPHVSIIRTWSRVPYTTIRISLKVSILFAFDHSWKPPEEKPYAIFPLSGAYHYIYMPLACTLNCKWAAAGKIINVSFCFPCQCVTNPRRSVSHIPWHYCRHWQGTCRHTMNFWDRDVKKRIFQNMNLF